MTSPTTWYDINRAILSVLNAFKTFLTREIYLWNHPLASIFAYPETGTAQSCFCHMVNVTDHTHCWCSIEELSEPAPFSRKCTEICPKSRVLSYRLDVCYSNTEGSSQHQPLSPAETRCCWCSKPLLQPGTWACLPPKHSQSDGLLKLRMAHDH